LLEVVCFEVLKKVTRRSGRLDGSGVFWTWTAVGRQLEIA